MAIDWSLALDDAFASDHARADIPKNRCSRCSECSDDVEARETNGLLAENTEHLTENDGVPRCSSGSNDTHSQGYPVLERTDVHESPNYPDEWWDGYHRMSAVPSVPGVEPAIWHALGLGFATLLQDGWAEQAHVLGWSALDVFGCWPAAPVRRIDQRGLIWFLHPGIELVAMSDATATLNTGTGASRRFFRRTGGYEPATVPVWELVNSPVVAGSLKCRPG
jgi:hypothetical protein